MSSLKLIFFRLFNISLGRIPVFSRVLKKVLLKVIVLGNDEKYCASSKFFDIKDLGDG